MNCLWSDKPVNALAKSVESMTSLQRHVTLEALIGLMRNTGTAQPLPLEADTRRRMLSARPSWGCLDGYIHSLTLPRIRSSKRMYPPGSVGAR